MSRIQVPSLPRVMPVEGATPAQAEQESNRSDWFSLMRRVAPMIIQFKSAKIAVAAGPGSTAQEFFSYTTFPELSVLRAEEWAPMHLQVPDDNGATTAVVADVVRIDTPGVLFVRWVNNGVTPQMTPENKFVVAYRRT